MTERDTELASKGGPVFRDHQHRILPSDSLAIGCCVDANTTRDYGMVCHNNVSMIVFKFCFSAYATADHVQKLESGKLSA